MFNTALECLTCGTSTSLNRTWNFTWYLITPYSSNSSHSGQNGVKTTNDNFKVNFFNETWWISIFFIKVYSLVYNWPLVQKMAWRRTGGRAPLLNNWNAWVLRVPPPPHDQMITHILLTCSYWSQVKVKVTNLIFFYQNFIFLCLRL